MRFPRRPPDPPWCHVNYAPEYISDLDPPDLRREAAGRTMVDAAGQGDGGVCVGGETAKAMGVSYSVFGLHYLNGQ